MMPRLSKAEKDHLREAIRKRETDRLGDLWYEALLNEVEALSAAIREHRSQRADDRCIEDDDRLYEALDDGIKCDRRVGSKEEMLRNCARFIERRCESGHWPTYQELLAVVRAVSRLSATEEICGGCWGLKVLADHVMKEGTHECSHFRKQLGMGGRSRLAPSDYFYVRFVKPADPDTGVTAGYEGIVIEHNDDLVVVEVAPWDENGEPLVIVAVAPGCVERIEKTLEQADRLRINQRWVDMERWIMSRQKKL
jgi:hypothetical protein